MLPEPLWPGTEFARAEMIQADFYPAISRTRSNTSQVQDFESLCLSNLTSSLWKGWSSCQLLEQRCLPEKPQSLSLSLQLDTWTNPRVNSEAHGHWEKGILTESSFPWSIFFYLFPGLSWQGKVLARNIGGTSDSEIITKLFSPANDIKGWARVVVFNHFWVTHIFKNLMKALYSLPGENQVCAHTQHSVCECRQFSWSIVHLRVSQGSMNPSLMMNPKKYLHGPLADKALLHLSLLRQFREAGTHSTHTERYCRHGF